MSTTHGIEVMSVGLVYASVCAPDDADGGMIEAHTNAAAPTGIGSRWEISDDPTFADGTPNPCPCGSHPGRRHWLLSC